MILSESRTSKLPPKILDILWCRAKEVNCFEMWHRLSGLGNGIDQLHQKHLFLEKLWLWICHTNNTHLQLTKQEEVNANLTARLGFIRSRKTSDENYFSPLFPKVNENLQIWFSRMKNQTTRWKTYFQWTLDQTAFIKEIDSVLNMKSFIRKQNEMDWAHRIAAPWITCTNYNSSISSNKHTQYHQSDSLVTHKFSKSNTEPHCNLRSNQ